MSLQLVANHLAQKGRGPDSTLVHMSNREVAGLQALAKQHGGELSVNPDTGLPEAGFLDNILPTIAGAGLTYFSGGATSPLMAAGIVGGISALDSKDLSKGLMAGLGAYGGGSMVGGLAGMGLGADAATATAPASEAAMQKAINDGTYQTAVGTGASNFGELFKTAPMEALSAAGGGSGYKAAGILGAAAAPMLADEMVETTTEAPEQSRGMIRPYTYSRQQVPQDYQGQQGNMGSKERRYFNESYTAGDPYAAAGGGLVALASGGYTNQNIFRPTTPLPENNMYGASRDAYDYLMGVNPTSGTGGTGGGIDGIGTPPPTGTGKYVFDPVTKQYKWVPDPIKPVDVAPVFENPVQRGGGGGGNNRGTDGFDGGPTSTNTSGDSNAEGNGFAPTSQGAYNVSRLGQAVSTFSPLIGGVIGGYGNYLARNVDPNYSHEGLNAGPAPTQSTNDGTAGEQAAQQALADGTAAAALQATYDRATSLSSPTATGGIASLAPAFGTTTPTNDGNAGEGAAQAAQAQSQAQAAADARQSANDGNAGQAAAARAEAASRAADAGNVQAPGEAGRGAAPSAPSAPSSNPGDPGRGGGGANAPSPPMGANASPSDGGAPPSGGGGGGGGGGRVICTHFYRKGEMSRDMWRSDLEFTFKNLSPTTVRGYQYWAIPYVKLMRKSKLAENIMRPLAMHRAKELSYQMGRSPKGSLFGKVVRLIGEPTCFTIGLFVGEQNWQSLWNPAKD